MVTDFIYPFNPADFESPLQRTRLLSSGRYVCHLGGKIIHCSCCRYSQKCFVFLTLLVNFHIKKISGYPSILSVCHYMRGQAGAGVTTFKNMAVFLFCSVMLMLVT